MVSRLILPGREAGPVAFSADGKLIAEGGAALSGRIRVLDAGRARKSRRRFDVGMARVPLPAAFTDTSGKRLVSGLDNSTTLIWNLSSSE